MRKTTEIYSAVLALLGAALVGAGIALAFTPAPVQQFAQHQPAQQFVRSTARIETREETPIDRLLQLATAEEVRAADILIMSRRRR